MVAASVGNQSWQGRFLESKSFAGRVLFGFQHKGTKAQGTKNGLENGEQIG
jgi:hypothetical protein